MLYSYFIDVKSVPCYNLIGKGDCSPLPSPCKLCHQKKDCNCKVYNCGDKIDFICERVILITAFLFGSFTQRLYLLSDSII